jgi:pSer/pThr/pTyr-binding forkhead associated (FHA) protein
VNAIEPSHATAAESLISELNALRRAAGNPSLGQLVRLSQRKLAKATLDDHLAGRRRRLPPWRLVSAYVTACHEAASSTGLDVRELGTLEEWYDVWKAALESNFRGFSPLKSPTNADNASAPGKPTQVLSLDDRTAALRKVHSIRESSKSFAADQPTIVGDPNNITASIGPVLQQIEERSSKRAQSLPSRTGLLIVINGATIGKNFKVEHNLTTIGRHPENDIWLNDPTVSRRHAVIRRRGDNFFVDDVGSSNGTFLHGDRIEYESSLSSYDELYIGAFAFLFVQGGTSSQASSRKDNRLFRSTLAEDLAEDIVKDTAKFNTQGQGWAEEHSYDDNHGSRIRWPRWGSRD